MTRPFRSSKCPAGFILSKSAIGPSSVSYTHLDVYKRQDQLHKHFFQLVTPEPRGPVWEPPADILETDRQFLILIALPGVDPSGVTVVIDENALHIVGERPLMISRDTVIRRLEIPYGRFEKRISLPAGNYKMTENVLMNGCLRLVLNKLG